MRIGSLFAGIGGFDLAARWMGWTTAWVSEIDPYASAVLKKHFPEAPNLGDITTIDGTKVPPVDILCGGFPCQDISAAGREEGINGSRSGLWSHYARLIGEIKPRWVVIENSPLLRSRGLDRVLKDLAAVGYDAEWHCIPAGAVGAWHKRDRIWIVSHPTGPRRENGDGHPLGQSEEEPQPERLRGEVPDSSGVGLQGFRSGGKQEPHPHVQPLVSLCGREGPQVADWEAEPAVGRVVDGYPGRVDRVRCLGNAIVPEIAYRIFQSIDRYEILAKEARA